MTNHSYKTILTKFSDENKDLIIKLFIEPFAIIITCILQKTKISANHITIFNLIISITFLTLAFLVDFIRKSCTKPAKKQKRKIIGWSAKKSENHWTLLQKKPEKS